LAYFSEEQNFSTTDISDTFCWSATKFDTVRGLANQHLLPCYQAVTRISPLLIHL